MTALVERHDRQARAGTIGAGVRPARFTAMVVAVSPTARESLARALVALGARDVTEAASIAEARARAHAHGPRDLCVSDVDLPDGSGITLVAELRAAGWSRGVVVSAGEDPYTVRAALAAGVRGFLVSSTSPASQESGPPRPRSGAADGLSGREIEVLQLVAEGRSNKEIGDVLGLSALTVKSHLARIARKLGTGDRAEMVALALRAGVIS
jgi:DNA-binding NarL/FixJ family response regulator